jgi:hypothetical protein
MYYITPYVNNPRAQTQHETQTQNSKPNPIRPIISQHEHQLRILEMDTDTNTQITNLENPNTQLKRPAQNRDTNNPHTQTRTPNVKHQSTPPKHPTPLSILKPNRIQILR